jgi:hypothetical protein
MKSIAPITAVMVAVLAAATNVTALAQTPAPAQTQAQQRIYGSQLMTAQERNEHQQRMRELKTREEREQFRKEHHAKMQERAKERGITLPDEPPMKGRGAAPRPGGQPGMGPGAGGPRGPGGGSGRP